jgi:hypothetical protein
MEHIRDTSSIFNCKFWVAKYNYLYNEVWKLDCFGLLVLIAKPLHNIASYVYNKHVGKLICTGVFYCIDNRQFSDRPIILNKCII